MSARTKTALAASVTVVAVVVSAFLMRWPSPKNAALAARQKAMAELGARIAKLRPECNVLVLSNPFAQKAGYFNEKSQFERAGLQGLRQGLGGHSAVKIVFPEIRPECADNPLSVTIPPDCRTPLSFLIQPASLDQLAEGHPECRVIVSLIGLPIGVEHLKIWGQQDPRCFALLLPDLSLLGPRSKTAEAFQRGKLLAAVVEDCDSGNPLIITQNNIGEILERQPKALGY